MEVLIAVIGATVAIWAFFLWTIRIDGEPRINGDAWYIRQMAFTKLPVSPPYCWRPLVPLLARIAGFDAVSHAANLATPILLFFYLGGEWAGLLCALIYMAAPDVYRFNIKNVDYVDAVGHALLVLCLWGLRDGWMAAWGLLFLAPLCRETLLLVLAPVALLWNPFMLAPLAVGLVVSRVSRTPDWANRHPLVEKGSYATLVKWVNKKRRGIISWPHVIQPLRGTPLAVPFVWGQSDAFFRVALVGAAGAWFGSLPATGQRRIVCYSYALLLPFVYQLPLQWLGFVTLVCWFWPIDYAAFDEGGGDIKFRYLRGTEVQHMCPIGDESDSQRRDMPVWEQGVLPVESNASGASDEGNRSTGIG